MNHFAITLAAALLGTAAPNDQTASACVIAQSNWAILAQMPKPGTGTATRRAVNIISIDEKNDVLWNGDSVRQGEIQKYLGIVKQMPADATLTVLAADPHADCDFVVSIRETIDSVLHCSPLSCAIVGREQVKPVPSQLHVVSQGKS